MIIQRVFSLGVLDGLTKMIHYLGYIRIIFLKRALQLSIFKVTLRFHFILPIFSYFLFFSSTNSFILSSFKFSSSELHQIAWHFQESGPPSCWNVHLPEFSSGRDTWTTCPQVSNSIPHCAPSLSRSPLCSGNNVSHSILKVNRLQCSQTKAKLTTVHFELSFYDEAFVLLGQELYLEFGKEKCLYEYDFHLM